MKHLIVILPMILGGCSAATDRIMAYDEGCQYAIKLVQASKLGIMFSYNDEQLLNAQCSLRALNRESETNK